MREIIRWLNDAVSEKGIEGGMSCYCVANGEIRATTGKITAGHPWAYGGEYLVPGDEFERVLARMPGDPTLTAQDSKLVMKSGRFRGTVETLPVGEWNYQGVDEAKWLPMPQELPELLKTLREFISDNAVQQWAASVAIEDGWAFATNNITLAGAQCTGLQGIEVLLPVYAIDFLLSRLEGLRDWCWTSHYCGFRWSSGAWMRSQLMVGKFPDTALRMVKQAHSEKPTQVITDEFRAAIERVAALADETVILYADRVVSKFGKAVVEDGITSEVPQGYECSIWGAKFLLPALRAADCWSPAAWPNPAPFSGPRVKGYAVGRRQ